MKIIALFLFIVLIIILCVIVSHLIYVYEANKKIKDEIVKKNKKGFTLIEAIIVMMIIFVIASMFVPCDKDSKEENPRLDQCIERCHNKHTDEKRSFDLSS